MLCAQLGNAQSYYGNIQLAFYNPRPYTWGAWVRPGHYQPPLTEAEEQVVEERRAYSAPPIEQPKPDNESIILRLQHTARMQEIANYKYDPPKRMATPQRSYQDEDEDYFILM